ncbi:MAG TPA: carboxylesterase/lipase family protein [Bryobacteraceae bacterium]|nr:carboxylesterase/lipase family protein [Bryobacteraceae bacterium]
MKNSSVLVAGGRAAMAIPLAVTSARSAPASPIATTTFGKLRGLTEDGIHVFRGIPYGADTSGKNRFMPPKKPTPWKDVRDATTWGRVAPQPLPGGSWDSTRATRWYTRTGGMGEDCLLLNIWTPAIKDGGKRAVMFSIHGGGFTSGTSHNPVFDGRSLAKMGDVVVVTINHRLGALGYMHLGELAPEFAYSGVAGMMDIVAALEWVRDNIENFGGDPGKVMIFGQSGGGGKVCHLMAMPSAKGLFHRAAIQSGATMRTGRPENALKSTDSMLQQLGLTKSRFSELQDIPFEMIVGAQTAVRGNFSPVLDGKVVPRDPFEPDAPAVSSDVPMMGGSNLHDFGSWRTDIEVDEAAAKEQAAKALGGADSDRIWTAYRSADPDASPSLLLARITNDRTLRANTRTVIERKTELGKAPGFLYLLTWPAPYMNGRFGSVHGTDVPLIFRNPNSWPLTADSKDNVVLADRMAGAFIAFAKTGNPSTPELPWPAYNPKTKPTMIFDVRSKAQENPHADLMAMLPPAGSTLR